MPVRYGSILDEARVVRSGAGLFDVSRMGRLELAGADADDDLKGASESGERYSLDAGRAVWDGFVDLSVGVFARFGSDAPRRRRGNGDGFNASKAADVGRTLTARSRAPFFPDFPDSLGY